MPPSNHGQRMRELPDEQYPHQELTGRIIGAFLEVYRALGFGFLESAYRRALAVELAYAGLVVSQEVHYALTHRGVAIGTYRADLIVESAVVVEVKAGLLFDPIGPVQLLNYLKVSRLPVGLLLHFGPRATIRRVIESGARVDAL